MTAFRNLTHAAALALWALAGLVFSLKCLFGPGPVVPALWTVASYWLWFAGFAAVMSWLALRFRQALVVALVHLGGLVLLMLIPRVFPLSLLRLGLDLLAGTR